MKNQSYKKSWIKERIIFLSLIAIAGIYYYRAYLPRHLKPSASSRSASNYFFILRLPEFPNRRVDHAAIEKRLEQWMESLEDAGFRPVLLSEALAAFEGNFSLPKKAVVLIYEPGYRETYDGISPIFARHHFPLSWVTSSLAKNNNDPRYLRSRSLFMMNKMDGVDVGFFSASTATFVLEPSFRSANPRQSLKLEWAPNAGRSAVNTPETMPALNRLDVNVAWTGPQLIERLLTETPVGQRSTLTAISILKRQWGISAENISPEIPSRFDLLAQPESRSASLTWHGTLGCKDMKLELDVQSLVGDFWTYLRYDVNTGRGVLVGFTRDSLIVEDNQGPEKRRAATIPWSMPADKHLRHTITLVGNKLQLAAQNEAPRFVSLSMGDVSPPGTVTLVVHSKIRGMARAKSIKAVMTPYPKI